MGAKLIINACINGMVPTRAKNQHTPITPEEVISIPSNASILSASLNLYINNSPFAAPADPVYNLHPVLSPWTEGTSNAGDPGGQGTAATPNDPTWTFNAFNSSTWTTAGGDYTASSANTAVGFIGETSTWSSVQMAADVQNWLNNPASNHGWILIGDETLAKSARRFASGENLADPTPVLTIVYAVPEPSTLTFFGISLLLILIRRRFSSNNL